MLGQQQGYMSIKCRKLMEGRIATIGKLMNYSEGAIFNPIKKISKCPS